MINVEFKFRLGQLKKYRLNPRMSAAGSYVIARIQPRKLLDQLISDITAYLTRPYGGTARKIYSPLVGRGNTACSRLQRELLLPDLIRQKTARSVPV